MPGAVADGAASRSLGRAIRIDSALFIATLTAAAAQAGLQLWHHVHQRPRIKKY